MKKISLLILYLALYTNHTTQTKPIVPTIKPEYIDETENVPPGYKIMVDKYNEIEDKDSTEAEDLAIEMNYLVLGYNNTMNGEMTITLEEYKEEVKAKKREERRKITKMMPRYKDPKEALSKLKAPSRVRPTVGS